MKTFDISTPLLLEKCVREILQSAAPPAAFALSGHPGAGKTTLVRMAARILDVRESVQSPTFNLLNIYEGKSPDGRDLEIFHYDFYRLGARDALFDLQVPATSSKIPFYVFVEWPEKISLDMILPDIDLYALTINTEYSPETSEIIKRTLTIHRIPENEPARS